MKKRILLNPLFLAATLGYGPLLLAKDAGVYIGLGVGQTKTTIESLTADNLPLPDIFTTPPVPISSGSANSSNTTWTIYGGYQFNRFLAIEAHYLPLGEHTRDFTGSARVDFRKPQPKNLSISGFGTFQTADRLKVDGFGLTAMVMAPLTNHLAFFAKYGIFQWSGNLYRDTKFNYNFRAVPPTYSYTEKDTGYSPVLGFGAFYKLKHGISLRAEWMKINSVGGTLSTGKSDVNLYLLGTQFNF